MDYGKLISNFWVTVLQFLLLTTITAESADCSVGQISVSQSPEHPVENDNVKISCVSPHSEDCTGTIQWRLNGHAYDSLRGVISRQSPYPSLTTSTLVIEAVRSGDSGNISCMFNGKESGIIRLQINSTETTTAQECIIFNNGVYEAFTTNIHENGNATFNCTFNYNKCDETGIVWTLNGQSVTENRRVTVSNTQDIVGQKSSTITFSQMIVRDSGILYCIFGSRTVGNIPIKVFAQPKVEISPQTMAVSKEERVELTCSIANVNEVDLEGIRYTWCNDTEIYNDNIIIDKRHGQSHLTIERVEVKTERFSCGATYIKDATPRCPASATSEINIIAQGVATRLCSDSGVWEQPNMINCVNEKISRAIADLDQFENGDIIGNKTVVLDGILNTMANTTSTGSKETEQPLSSGDLSKTTTVLDKMLDIVDTSASEISINKTTFVGVIDNVLSTNNTNTWSQVNKQADDGSSKILKTVENFGNVLWKSLSLGDNQTIHKDNIVVKVSRTKGSIEFQPDSKDKSKLHQSIALPIHGDKNFTATLYRTIGSILPTENSTILEHPSEVLALTVQGIEGRINSSNISLHFDLNNLRKKFKISQPSYRCVFWNFSSNGWSDEGCWFNEDHCECDHLTNFAVLMSPAGQLNDEDTARLRIISLVGCLVSIGFTVFTIIIFMVLWRARNFASDRNKILMNICVAFTIAYVIFIAGIDKTDNSDVCSAITFLLHFFFLAAFFLMLAEVISLLLKTTDVFSTTSKLKWILGFGWGAPAVVVAVTIGMTYSKQYHAADYCWLTPSNGVLFAFVGPVIAIITTNVLIFTYVMRILFSTQAQKNKSKKENLKKGIRAVCIFMPIIGFSWLFGILSLNEDLVIFQYLFAIFNSLQGLFIFFANVVFDPEVRNAIRNKLKLYKDHSRATDLTSSGAQVCKEM